MLTRAVAPWQTQKFLISLALAQKLEPWRGGNLKFSQIRLFWLEIFIRGAVAETRNSLDRAF